MSINEDALTAQQAQEAVQNGDTVTGDELQEIHKDLRPEQIAQKVAMEQYELELKEQPVYQKPRARARQGRKTYNTGPKGVLTDYEEAKLVQKARLLQNVLKRKNKNYMNINTNNINKFEVLDNDNNKIDVDNLLSNNSDKSENDSDDELNKLNKLQKWEIKNRYLPRFGTLHEMTAYTFNKEIDEAPKNIFIVVHIYQDYLERCVYMNSCLAKLAENYAHIKFLRARSDYIGLDDYPEIGLPTLIIFKNGKQLHNFIAMHKKLKKEKFDAIDIETFLLKHKIIDKKFIMPKKITNENKNEFLNNKNNKKKKKFKKINFYGNNNSVHSWKSKQKNNLSDDDDDSELDID